MKKWVHATILLLLWFLLSACQSRYSDDQLHQSQQVREAQLAQINHWVIRGKLAIISSKNKQSANLYWRKSGDQQQLKLTSFVGTTVLSLTSKHGLHTLIVDGKTHQHHDLDYLVEKVAGFPLPISHLSHWLKGVKASAGDVIQYHPVTLLPEQLSTLINSRPYSVQYQSYTLVGNVRLAKQLSIRHQDLRIKLAISQWEI
ncbi:lipoprotein insertase outer membrane protein LolB [Thalassotalea ponticola]|uniref:lipoprotein insertase outer membrane protein LolB n=1 Tax=Thalassotalea ponticola TaxID=1523392 RepID=UPI0025B5DD3E|nr:lipoprotein insertase outer membrane protein LolB [Thalassotalea ponticola]MDN3651570.1 lipoprotein insertase outer membrane protein LolB [Thalassotalea ponticola]